MTNFQENKKYYLRGSVIFLLVAFAFFWNGPLTESSGNLDEFVGKTVKNIRNIFNDNTRAVGSSPLSQFNIFYKPDLSVALDDYVKDTIPKYAYDGSSDDFYTAERYKSYVPKVSSPEILTPKASLKILPDVYLLMAIIKILVKLFILIGVFCILFCRSYRNKINKEYLTLNIVSFMLLGLIVIVPYASLDFCLDRAYLQVLTIVSFSAVLGGLMMLKFLKEKTKIFSLLCIFLLYFLFLSGFIPQMLGGSEPSAQLNNFGGDYNTFYTHDAEIRSGQWLYDNYQKGSYIYADKYASRKSLLSYHFDENWMKYDILPQVITKNSYVYMSNSNIAYGSASVYLQGTMVNYGFPSAFVNQNKNLIYNNSYSKIFK